MILLFGLLACAAKYADPGGDPLVFADSGAESGETGGETGETGGDSGDPATTAVWAHVLVRITVGGRTAGFDLDGDGIPNNAAATLGDLFTDWLAPGLAAGVRLPVVQLSDVQDWTDEQIGVALLTADDANADPSDNESGAALFDTHGALDADGLALERSFTSMTGGGFSTPVPLLTLEVGDLALASRVPIRVAGAADEAGESGQIGLAVSGDDVRERAVADGQTASLLTAIDNARDLDTDEDGVADAISVALLYDAVTCTLE